MRPPALLGPLTAEGDGFGRPLSLRARVALLAAVAVGAAVALSAVAAYATLRHELAAQADRTLYADATALNAAGRLAQQYDSAFIPLGDLHYCVVYADGSVWPKATRSVWHSTAERQVARGTRPESLRTIAVGNAAYRVLALPLQGESGSALVVARSLTEPRRVLHAVTFALFGVGLVGIVVAASAGLAVARAGLRPIRELTAAAEHVAATEELTPLAAERAESSDDEVARLAVAFNAMLAALAESRDRQRRLVADAGHELRTPLTSLRTNLDLLVQTETNGHPLPPEDRAQLLADVRAQVGELSGLVTDLVELAREDPAPAGRSEVDLAEVVERAVDRARRRGPGLAFDVRTEPWPVSGDPRLLERAVTNLLDNAAKWSPPQGTVAVSLSQGVLTVTDQGPGIAEADLDRVFDRFYRSSEARGMPGSGLGLSIVRQVAEQHGGTVRAERAEHGGARLVLALPAVAQPFEAAAVSWSRPPG